MSGRRRRVSAFGLNPPYERLPRLKQPRHRLDGRVVGVAEIFADAERVLGRAQQRIVVIRSIVGDTARAVIGDDEGRNVAATEIGGAGGIKTAAALGSLLLVRIV